MRNRKKILLYKIKDIENKQNKKKRDIFCPQEKLLKLKKEKVILFTKSIILIKIKNNTYFNT